MPVSQSFPSSNFALYSIVIANINISVNKLSLPFSIIVTIGILRYIHHFLLEDFSIAILMIVQFVATELHIVICDTIQRALIFCYHAFHRTQWPSQGAPVPWQTQLKLEQGVFRLLDSLFCNSTKLEKARG